MSAVNFVRLAFVLMFLVPGAMSVWVGLKGYKWFFNSSVPRLLRGYLGEKGAKIFYVILGILLIVCGLGGLWYVGTYGVELNV